MGILLRRQYCNDLYDNCNDNFNSAWWIWGRWVLSAGLIVLALALFICFSCYSSRRRRQQGFAPRPGTGWASGGWNNRNPQPYQQQPYYNQAAPPAYAPPPENNYYPPNNNGNNVELQQPGATYGGVYGQQSKNSRW